MIDKKVTAGAVGISLIFILTGIFFPEELWQSTNLANQFLRSHFGWFYLFVGLFFVLFCVVLAISKYGRVQLGNSKPEYSYFSWIAMLYSAGMGSGLLLRATQEPSYYYLNPVGGEKLPHLLAVEEAMKYAFFHWGFTAWGFYAVFGLVIAYFRYSKKDAFTTGEILNLRSKLGEKLPDILTAIATIFGVVAALGLGSSQLMEGVRQVFPELASAKTVFMLISVVGLLSLISALTGISKGIQWLSNLNIILSLGLMIYVFIQSNIWAIVVAFGIGLFAYLKEFFILSIDTGFYNGNPSFVKDWTVFYWAFWLAWAPFTGIFIARISKGRTIREFVTGVLIVPTLGSCIWFAVFGGSAFNLIGTGEIAEPNQLTDLFSSLFLFFGFLPNGLILKVVTIILLGTYLITSIDSATYVLSMMSSKGNEVPSKLLRVFWGILFPLLTMTMLYISGQQVLQTASNLLILSAFPMGFIMLGLCWKLWQKIR
ncbi:BCCT family transporter [Sediminitomix flava]|uniref:Glycine betaine transporter n=1 Tax=Sediminitomix flava TaxID=379075 RepID=A0A315YXA5_SEDFL|nr:BCCT family transporter [Sediminitomix flava]PWJ34107.1 glycine betaine transporter [Sediminitomix flava]